MNNPIDSEFDLIVVVEDDNEHFHIMREHLRRGSFAAHEVKRCSSFSEFTDLCDSKILENRRPIILCDQALSDSRPPETAREIIRRVPSDSIVLVVTSVDYGALADDILEAGAQDYLVKGDLNPRSLERAIRSGMHRKKLLIKLENAYQDADNFAKMVAHDLKSPLATAKMELDAIKRTAGKTGGAVSDENLDSVGEEIGRAATLIDQMLKYSRASWSKNQVEQLNPAGVARETLKHLGEEIATSGASVHIGKIPDVVTNRDALSQVFQNLIANAIKFNRSGVPKIEIVGRRVKDRVVVLVTDNGIGIPPENRYRIFDLGFSTSQSTEPSGIGLAICRRLLTLLDGSLRVRSSSDEGTTFEITLPAVSKEATETDHTDHPEEA